MKSKFFTILFSFTCALSADTIQFHNGDSIKGDLIELADGKLSFKGETVGKVCVPLCDVYTFSTDCDVTLIFWDHSTYQGVIEPSLSSGAICLEERAHPFSDIKRITTPLSPEPYPLEGRVGMALEANYGNTDSTDFDVTLELVKPFNDCSKVKAKGEYIRETKDSDISKHKGFLEGEYNHCISKCLDAYYRQKFSFDEKKDLDFRSEEVAGLKYLLYYHPRFEFFYWGGLGRTDSWYAETDDEDAIDYEGDFTLITGYGLWWDFYCKWRLAHETEVTGSIQGFDYYRVDSTSKIKVPLNDHWDLCFNYKLEYRNEPASDDTKPTDHTLKMEVGYSF